MSARPTRRGALLACALLLVGRRGSAEPLGTSRPPDGAPASTATTPPRATPTSVPERPLPIPIAPPGGTATAAPAPTSSQAVVHIAADYEGAWLLGRNRVDADRWRHLCQAPCDR